MRPEREADNLPYASKDINKAWGFTSRICVYSDTIYFPLHFRLSLLQLCVHSEVGINLLKPNRSRDAPPRV